MTRAAHGALSTDVVVRIARWALPRCIDEWSLHACALAADAAAENGTSAQFLSALADLAYADGPDSRAVCLLSAVHAGNAAALRRALADSPDLGALCSMMGERAQGLETVHIVIGSGVSLSACFTGSDYQVEISTGDCAAPTVLSRNVVTAPSAIHAIKQVAAEEAALGGLDARDVSQVAWQLTRAEQLIALGSDPAAKVQAEIGTNASARVGYDSSPVRQQPPSPRARMSLFERRNAK